MVTTILTVKFLVLLASGFLIQFPLIFLAIAIGTIGRFFDLPIGNAVGLLLSPGIAYFWAEGFHSNYHLAGALSGDYCKHYIFCDCSFSWRGTLEET